MSVHVQDHSQIVFQIQNLLHGYVSQDLKVQ